MDVFKEHFKSFKTCDITKIINNNDFNKLNNHKNTIFRPPDPPQVFERKHSSFTLPINKHGLLEPKDWEIYDIIPKNGLIFIKNPFTPSGQRYWIRRCLQDYTKKPNKLNIDAHIQLKKNWWEECHSGDDVKDRKLQKMLRWSTLGYHHDWDSKVYSENSKQEFPEDLSEICEFIAKACSFVDFVPQASIVNFYPMGSIMGGHTDHSEDNLEAPLISISFGQSAIFLIGGETKEVVPLALHLSSGDIVIMSGSSRLYYHGIPKIFKTVQKPWADDGKICGDWKIIDDFIADSRININVRQVLHNNQDSLRVS